MRIGKKTPKREKSAMTVSLYGNLFFVIVELVMAIYTSSQAVLLDAVYDGIEFCMLLPSIFLIPLLYKPSNEEYPFGYMQLETLFLVVKGVTMTAVTIGLIANNIDLLLHGGRVVDFQTVAGFELSACALGVVVTLYLYRKNKPLNSPPCCGVDGGLEDRQCHLPGHDRRLPGPGPDPLRLVPARHPVSGPDHHHRAVPHHAPVQTVISGIRDLILIPPEEETVREIKDTVEPILEGYDYSEIYYDIVRTGRKLWISVYLTLEKDEISLTRFKTAQVRCIDALARKYTNFYFELLPDIAFDVSELKSLP